MMLNVAPRCICSSEKVGFSLAFRPPISARRMMVKRLFPRFAVAAGAAPSDLGVATVLDDAIGTPPIADLAASLAVDHGIEGGHQRIGA